MTDSSLSYWAVSTYLSKAQKAYHADPYVATGTRYLTDTLQLSVTPAHAS